MKYHCMVNAFARALCLSPQELVKKLSHDGLGTFPGTDVQRTHHTQEMIDIGAEMGIWFCPIELIPSSTTPDYKQTFQIFFGNEVKSNFDRLESYLNTSRGVVLGIRTDVNKGHAVYNDHGILVDGTGTFRLFETSFMPNTYWRAVWSV